MTINENKIKISLGVISLLLLSQALPAESLWRQATAGAGMYADRKANNVGDLVTVIIQESASVSSSKSTNTNKSSSISSGISKLLYSSSDFLRGDDGELPGVGWSSSNTFSGGGDVSDQQSATTRLSAQIMDRQPNGNLIIEGVRRTILNNETSFVVLRGVIRPIDISSNNTILSSRIADAEVQLIAEGSLTQAQRKGWLNRAYDFVNPF
jgi:flagellar L-ring protein precursor FlgH